VRTPVLIVAGAEDATFTEAETRAMADAIPGASFTVLAGVAHLAALENPPLVNQLIDDYVFGRQRFGDDDRRLQDSHE
jgi:3-oxoadipate enol-lactonase